jgi:site-specific DNA-methyltransferase (adenine-specific)
VSITLLQGDCLERMKEIPDGSVDMVMSNAEDFKYCWVWMKNRPTNYAHAKNKPMKKHEDICVFSRGTTIHACQSDDRMTYNPQGLRAIDVTVNHKGKCASDVHFSARPSHGTHKRVATGYPHTILEFSTDMLNLHPTAKPVALMEYLIRTYTNAGETVLDNTMGSGTTGVACVNTGRSFIGIERDEAYFAIAKGRIEEAEVIT